jgi:large subunit ribosomal protein L15
MKLNRLADNPGARKKGKRLARGIGSGTGKTAGRGHKGQKSRSGVAIKGFEGGQMPLHRRLPKRGFHNIFRVVHPVVNLGRLQAAIDGKKIDPAKPIDAEALFAVGLLRRADSGVRILAKGEISAKVQIKAGSASAAAIAAVKKAGGEIVFSDASAPAKAVAKAKATAKGKSNAAVRGKVKSKIKGKAKGSKGDAAKKGTE